MNKYTKLTFDEMIRRKEQVLAAKKKPKTAELYIESLDGTITITEPPRTTFADANGMDDTLEADAYLVLQVVTEPSLKRLAAEYGCAEPTAMDVFGATAEQRQAGLQSLADKFTEIGHATGTLPENKHIEITADGNVVEVAGASRESIESVPEEHDTKITAQDNTAAGVKSAKDNIDSIKDKTVTITVQAVGAPSSLIGSNFAKFGNTGSFSVARNATGTQNFAGGLAMVNDQRGVADPRELIVDRGRAFIPDGRDVVLPLSRGAKVYTAAQTKRIMAGIPRFADGKDNSHAFISARDAWTHYTKTHAVTTTEELKKWVELSKQFTGNQKDVWDIEEQIYTLQRKINDELNKASLAYIDDRAALGDWDEYGDSAIDAFTRIRDSNKEAVDAGRLTYDEYIDSVSAAGVKLYDGRRAASEKWLAHEEKYNGLSVADYLAGIDRMRDYTTEYYMNGIISHREYIEAVAGMDELYLDKDKLTGIAAGAQVNVIESVSVNGTAQTVTDKGVNVTVPTAVSDLTNDSGFQTASDVSAAIASGSIDGGTF